MINLLPFPENKTVVMISYKVETIKDINESISLVPNFRTKSFCIKPKKSTNPDGTSFEFFQLFEIFDRI